MCVRSCVCACVRVVCVVVYFSIFRVKPSFIFAQRHRCVAHDCLLLLSALIPFSARMYVYVAAAAAAVVEDRSL